MTRQSEQIVYRSELIQFIIQRCRGTVGYRWRHNWRQILWSDKMTVRPDGLRF